MSLVNINSNSNSYNYANLYTQTYNNFGLNYINTNTTTSSFFNDFTNRILNSMKALNTNLYQAADTKVKNHTEKSELKDIGYDTSKGQKLAQNAAKNTVGFTHQCATYVKNAIQRSGLGSYEYGDAYQCADILTRNNNFKEISTNGLDLSALPAGCVLVYDKGVAGYSSKYGHTEITLGNGKAVSDGVTNNIRQGARVFVPVSTNYMA